MDNEAELKKVIPVELVSGVIDGKYTVENKGGFAAKSHVCLQFFDSGQNRIVEISLGNITEELTAFTTR